MRKRIALELGISRDWPSASSARGRTSRPLSRNPEPANAQQRRRHKGLMRHTARQFPELN